jgi:polysaccharide biosynthesis/export protein VpsN
VLPIPARAALSFSIVFAVLALVPALAAPPAPATKPAAQLASSEERDYRLGVGDVIRIEVHNEPDLTLETQLPSTGIIDYPFLGTVRAVGLTVAQLQNRITEGLAGDYLVKPAVNVRVVQYRPFYVRGKVRNSGGFPYVLGLTVEKAITVAGGFTDRASLKNIYLIKENSTQDNKIKVNLDSPVAPGDTIIVEESLF